MIALNLLPPERKAQLRAFRKLRFTRRLALAVVAASIVASGIVRGGLMLLERSAKDISAQSDTLQQSLEQDDLKDVSATVVSINQRTKILQGFIGRDIAWSPFLADFLRAMPSGVTLSEFTFDQRTRAVTISGVAATREDLIALQSAVMGGGWMENFPTSLSDLSKRTAIEFTAVTSNVPAATLTKYHP